MHTGGVLIHLLSGLIAYVSSGNTGTSVYYYMVALADWSEDYLRPILLSIEKYFPVSMESVGDSFPTSLNTWVRHRVSVYKR